MKIALMFCFLIFSLSPVFSNESTCRTTPEFRNFDFWIGEWNVHANGKLVGTSSIQLIMDDCVIFENYTGVSGYLGKSFNMFNAAIKKWQQLYVDNRGGVLILEGEYSDGKMQYWGKTPQADGSIMKEKLTFYRLPENRVRQVWDQSPDSGKTWKTIFDGTYSRK